MIQLQGLEHGYAGKLLFQNLSFSFKEKRKIALVGANGTGKTTLFRLISEKESPLKGQISFSKQCRIEYLAQEMSFSKDISVLDLVLLALEDLFALEKKAEDLREEISSTEAKSRDDRLLGELERIQNHLDLSDLYQAEAKAKKILAGLGFNADEFHQSIHHFSGGWQMRALLAKMLLKEPDFLLLDEPTNHLDIESLAWLENYLASYTKSVIIISHDQSFLDRIVSEVVELASQKLVSYIGNYSHYLVEKEERFLREQKQAAQVEQQMAHIQAFVDRFRYKATKAKQVQSRIKMLERMDLQESSIGQKKIAFNFQVSQASSKTVFHFENLSKSYGEKEVLNSLEGTIYRGDRIAIMGANGAGKSTFIRLLRGDLNASSGRIESNDSVKIGYYSQHQLDELYAENSIIQELSLVACEEKRNQIRSILGAFLFSGDDVDKKISVLSGGEKARVALAKLLVQEINTLILDEPTNHLDIDSKERLQLALMDFNGSLLIISHDRSFLDGLVNEVYYFHNGNMTVYDGEIQEISKWIERFKAEKNLGENSKVGKKESYQERKKQRNVLKKLENDVKALEKRLEEIEQEKRELAEKMNRETDHLKLMELQEKMIALDEEELKDMAVWEENSEAFAALSKKLSD